MTRSIANLATSRASFGAAPRSFSWGDKVEYLRIPRPAWMWIRNRKDPLAEILKNQDLLLAEGRLVWGAFVQANSLLFSRGRDSHPAEVIYSPDTAAFDDNPDLLYDIARRLGSLKGTEQEDPELAQWSSMLASEMDREMRAELPRQLTGGATVYSTVVLVARKHLPDGMLNASTSIFPLLIAPDRTATTMMLPSRYWYDAEPERWHI